MTIILVSEITNLPNEKFREFVLKMVSNRLIRDAISRDQYREIFSILEIEADRHKVIELLIRMGILRLAGDTDEQTGIHGQFQGGKRQGVCRTEGSFPEGNR
jgi:hypothetical protein